MTTLRGHSSRGTNELSALHGPIRDAQLGVDAGAPDLPLAVYYPTNRGVLDIPERIRTPHEFDSISAYDGALEGPASDFRGFFEWFRQEEDVENETTARGPQLRNLSPTQRAGARTADARSQ